MGGRRMAGEEIGNGSGGAGRRQHAVVAGGRTDRSWSDGYFAQWTRAILELHAFLLHFIRQEQRNP